MPFVAVAMSLAGAPAGGASDADVSDVAEPRILTVGPSGTHRTVAEAADAVRDGDIVEIMAGTYRGDVAVWRRDDLVIRGVGGPVRLIADGEAAEGKGIFVVKGDRTIIENLEFSGARVPDRNGAGIRLEGADLIVRNCRFIDNENGILANPSEHGRVIVERSEFARNGAGDGYSHNIYVNAVAAVSIRFSWVRDARGGHGIKSRARVTDIRYNRITEEEDGPGSSYLIDIPNGGRATIIGNLLRQGPRSRNGTLIAYGAEGLLHPRDRLVVVNNTLVTDRPSGIFVNSFAPSVAGLLANNLLIGDGRNRVGDAVIRHANVTAGAHTLVAADRLDFRPVSKSPARDAADPSDPVRHYRPHFEYRHPRSGAPRRDDGRPDAGALEAAP